MTSKPEKIFGLIAFNPKSLRFHLRSSYPSAVKCRLGFTGNRSSIAEHEAIVGGQGTGWFA